MSKLTAAIETWAEERDLSLTAALRELKVSTNVFYRWQRGSLPQPATLKRIAEKLGLAPATLREQRERRQQCEPTQSPASIAETVFIAVPRAAWAELAPLLSPVLARYGAAFGVLEPIAPQSGL